MQNSRGQKILIIFLSVIVIVSGIAGIVSAMKGKSEEKQTSSGQTTGKGVVDEVGKDKLLKNKYPEVNALIVKYREGLKNGDTAILKEVYNTEEGLSTDVFISNSKMIEDYTDIVCYTKKGLEAGDYFVFIYDLLKLRDIDTKAPNLSLVYVKTSADGKLYIYRGEKNPATGTYEYDADIQQYIALLNEDDEVKDLMATVYQEKEAACAKDEALRDFIDGLTSPASDMTDETGVTDKTLSGEDETAEETRPDETE